MIRYSGVSKNKMTRRFLPRDDNLVSFQQKLTHLLYDWMWKAPCIHLLLSVLGKESFYEELARIQKVEMEKRDRDRKDNIKQELVIAAAKKAEEEAKRR